MKGFSLSIQNHDFYSEDFFPTDLFDNFIFENQEFKIVFEGLLLNRASLLQKPACSSLPEFFLRNFPLQRQTLFAAFDGEFRGYIFDKIKRELFVFTNQTATQRIFYTKNEAGIFIDTSLVRLSTTLKKRGLTLTPDIENLYQLLAFGNMLEDSTPIKNVFKLKDGHFLRISENQCRNEAYIKLGHNTYTGTKKQAISQIDEIFAQSVTAEYSRVADTTNDIAFLSGGLDSRMALLYAIKGGNHPAETVCFSQTGYWDEKIARSIASDFDLNFKFIPLEPGNFLTEIDTLTEISEGTCHYTGGIHVNYAAQSFTKDYKIFHSGQIGDGILGGFNTAESIRRPDVAKITVRPKFAAKIKNTTDLVLKEYESEEPFFLRNIAFNRTVLGAQVLNRHGVQCSPFMGKDFMAFSLSLPPEWKFGQKFYIEWLAQKCPEAAAYRWERTLLKPSAPWKTVFGDKVTKRTYLYFNRFFGEKALNTMTPYQEYFEKGEAIRNFYDQYFNENIYRLEEYSELCNDVRAQYGSKDFYDKSIAVNILSVFKLYFG